MYVSPARSDDHRTQEGQHFDHDVDQRCFRQGVDEHEHLDTPYSAWGFRNNVVRDEGCPPCEQCEPRRRCEPCPCT